MAADSFRITLAQLNPVAGDVAGNAAKVREARSKAAADGADLLVLPELFLAGAPPQQSILDAAFLSACRAAIEALARETADGGPAVLIGAPWLEDGKLYNAVALLDAGRVAATRLKINLPDDQKRSFTRGPAAGPVSVRGVRIGIAIGEDIWPERPGDENVVETLAETGAELVVVPAAACYVRGGGDRRLSAAVARVTESDLPLIWLNQTGGQVGQVFDGASFALNADLSVAAQLLAFVEDVTTLAWSRDADGWQGAGPVAKLIEGDEADYAARVLGLRDHVAKSGFDGVVLGLTASLDTALSLAIAVDALGPAKVRGVVLAGADMAAQAQEVAIAAAARLGVAAEVMPIAAAVAGFETILPGQLASGPHRALLAQVRATLLNALASLFGALALGTGEASKLQGDEIGRGFNLLADIPPAQLSRLAALRNRWQPADALGALGEVIAPDLICGD
ncbi:putative glutamine-dependent NAD(+) synthetase (NadE-like) [Bradyrhizobium sp. ORS 285]|uniref:nitrilase-related carbon-nitrogen hydrolase n=1 Tax=Bradyrhizobium sp. ORS 285 TaxID=115808 RepID=UPI0002407DC5|nr:nitrilase-related carbon-nitrogen hydrolase [Bradyrhizobium sp. ORS 285]CCD83823.1 putative glutamine-dependent NAD(+) synthetase (NadE-like) [Bradyrhizobium sp. ORS 285]SMX59366.1 putative glutamine-dependent NAD(+) synthetase (NadE-like) [Bradyrhizobium sp. ORS 285]